MSRIVKMIKNEEDPVGFMPLEVMPREGDVLNGERDGEIVYWFGDISQTIMMRTLHKNGSKEIIHTSYCIDAKTSSPRITGSERVLPDHSRYDELNQNLTKIQNA